MIFCLRCHKIIIEAKNKKSKIVERVLTAQTVLKDLLVGAYTVLLLGAYALGIFLVVFLIFADGSPEAREQAKWCAEYMPEASSSECAAEAGW